MSLVDRIGNTPLVRLRRVTAGLVPGVEVYAKCEWLNPGGSVKDRAASAILAAVETSGALRPGVRLLDSSSGNTGIAYGMMCAHRGWPLTLCLPANANRERKRVLRAYGVEVVELIRKARALVAEFPDRYLFVNVYLGEDDIRHLQRDDTPLKAGDVLTIVPSIAGGR
jgi:cysteine synthase B